MPTSVRSRLASSLTLLLAFVLLVLVAGCERRAVVFPAGIDHTAWDELLAAHVDERGLVAYERWRQDQAAVDRLDAYLAQYAGKPEAPAAGADRQAALINLYNALCIRMVLRLDPERSLWSHSPFGQRIHSVGGVAVSLDDIEHGAVRPEVGYRGHGALVCAALSCPPLASEAFTGDRLDEQLDERMRVWLARPDLNRFLPDEKRIELSKIFSWFSGDFATAPGGLTGVLLRHAPERHHELIRSDPTIAYRPYDKSLNAQAPTADDSPKE